MKQETNVRLTIFHDFKFKETLSWYNITMCVLLCEDPESIFNEIKYRQV